MRVVSLHPDVLVVTSAIWQTNCVIVRGLDADGQLHGDGATGRSGGSGDAPAGHRGSADAETFVIDSPILPDELDALPSLIAQAGFPESSGLLATHGDWDHLLGRLAFSDLALGCAESTAARMTASPGEAQRELRAFDAGLYIQRPRPLMLGQVQPLPVPGRCEIGAHELQLHPADGHTPDGMAIWIGWAGVLCAGDYLSTVEPPDRDLSGSVEAYLATLERLRPLVISAAHVVPGHGPVLDAERALGVLDEHVDWLTRRT